MQRIDCESLVLRDTNDERVADISDLLVGDVQDDGGKRYRDLTLMIRISPGVQPGKPLRIFDTTTWQTLFSFVSNRIHFQIRGECFQRIDARVILDAP